MDYFRVLGVPRNASSSEIEAAFHKWKRIYDPATHPDPVKAALYAKQIVEAYLVLSNPSRRKEHERSVEVAGRLMQFDQGIYWEYRPNWGRYVRCDDQDRAAADYNLEMQRLRSSAKSEYDREAKHGGMPEQVVKSDRTQNPSETLLIETPIHLRSGVYYRDEQCSSPFYEQEAAAVLWDQKQKQETRAKECRQAEFKVDLAHAVRVSVAWLSLVAMVLGGIALWSWLDNSGHIPHDEMAVVYSPEWQYGEYKRCTTVNGAKPQNLLCEGGVPSGRVEDGKEFDVRFWGRTHDEEKPAAGGAPDTALSLFYWNCRKNEGGDPSITCYVEKIDDSSSHP